MTSHGENANSNTESYAYPVKTAGDCEECGNDAVQDIAERIRDLTTRAEDGDDESMKKLAWHYENGVGVKRDLNMAFDLYTRAFHGPSGIISEALADETWTRNEEMIETWLRLAEEGQAGSQNCVGLFHFVCQHDKEKGFEWFEKSSRQGCDIAMFNVGWCYSKGQGVTQDFTKAFELYLKAANNGNADAMFNVGVCYSEGQGVTQDFTKAFKYNLKSANNGDADAVQKLGDCYKNGNTFTKDIDEAIYILQTKADKGDEESMVRLAWHHENGVGVDVDMDKAYELYSRAFHVPSTKDSDLVFRAKTGTQNGKMVEVMERLSKKGHSQSQNTLGVCYGIGDCVPQDDHKAFSLFESSAMKEHVSAMANLGWCYREGRGFTRDKSKAFKQVLKTANKGNAVAMNNVGVCYENGWGVTQDLNKSI